MRNEGLNIEVRALQTLARMIQRGHVPVVSKIYSYDPEDHPGSESPAFRFTATQDLMDAAYDVVAMRCRGDAANLALMSEIIQRYGRKGPPKASQESPSLN
jgi:hypothetical protein